jgi:NADH dehydrogenase FAD-containing subunit
VDRSDGTKGKESKESKETEFRVTLVDGHEFIRRATGKDQLLKQIQQLLSGGYVRERHEDGSVTFHVNTRVASVTAQRVGTGVNTKKSRGRAAKTATAQ